MAALLAAHPGGAHACARGLRPLASWLAACAAAGTLAAEAPALAAPLCADAALATAAVHELCRFPEAAGVLAAAVNAHPRLPDTPEPTAAPGKRLSALDAADPACRASMLQAGWLLRRYSLGPAPPFRATPRSRLHGSDDGGLDAGAFHRRVVLKFMRRRDAFERERDRRTELLRGDATSADYILPVLAAHAAAGASADSLFTEEAALRGLFPQLLVLPRADADLAAALAARPDARAGAAGRDWRAARHMVRQLAACLAHLHSAGVVHGAFSPRAAVRCGDSLGGKWKLIDLDGVVSFARGEYISDRVAPACAPPELCARGEGEDGVWLRCVPERGVLEAWEPGSLKADVSYDMWAFGCVLYHIVTGVPLWPDADADEALPQPTLEKLASWDSAMLDAALAPLMLGAVPAVSSPTAEPGTPGTPSGRRDAASAAAAASLLRMLLHPKPAMRPASMDAVLDHPFLNPAGGCFHSERGAPQPEPRLSGSGSAPGSPAKRGAVEELAESLLSAVAGFNFSLLAGGVTGNATAASAPSSITASPSAPAVAPAPGIGAAIVAAISGSSPRKGPPPPASMGPPPPAVVGPFPKTGLPRFGAYPAAAAAAAADRAPAGAEGGAAGAATLDADSPRYAAAVAAASGGAFSWAEPVPAARAGTVAPTRSLVGVPAVPGGVRSAPSSPHARRRTASPSPLGRRAAEGGPTEPFSLVGVPAAGTRDETATAAAAPEAAPAPGPPAADGFAVVEL